MLSFGTAGGRVSASSCSVSSDSLLLCSGFAGVGVSHTLVVTVANQPSLPSQPALSFFPPNITSYAYATLPTAGGSTVTMYGTNFGPSSLNAVWARFGAVAVVRYSLWTMPCTVSSSTLMTCVSPEGTGGPYAFIPVVANQTGSFGAPRQPGFDTPEVLTVPVSLGTARGGTVVTVSGRCVAGFAASHS